jgi:hypothetical protein
MIIEHRLSQRISFREPIKYGLDDPTFTGYTFDLSENGIGIKASKVFPPDTKLVFDMYMGDDVIRIEGVVARVRPILSEVISIMGVKFSGRADRIKHIYVQRLNKQHYLDKTIEEKPIVCPMTGDVVMAEVIKSDYAGSPSFIDVVYCSFFKGCSLCEKTCLALLNKEPN